MGAEVAVAMMNRKKIAVAVATAETVAVVGILGFGLD